MNNINLIGHGFIPPVILSDEYIFGANQLPDTIIQDNGNWMPYLPEGERQARLFFDTYGCTIYNTLAPIEVLERKLFNEQSEYAERPVYIGTGTRPPGSNPHVIAEWIRKNGLVPEAMLPFTDVLKSLDEYASPNPLSTDILWAMKDWLYKKEFGHEWVFDGGIPKEKQEKLKEELRRSPVAVSVIAWKERNGIYYKEDGDIDSHWTMLANYEDNHPIIQDSYAPFIKKLEKNYNFGFAKRYWIDKKETDFNTLQQRTGLFEFLKRYFGDIMKCI